jgi:ribosomal protein L37AE/L43A
MIVSILVPLVAVLAGGAALARRAIDPSCPSCQRRAWAAAASGLSCTSCGWSNVAKPAAPAEEPAGAAA